MEPRIQYAKTADGVSIAFWTLGQGVPFVQCQIFPGAISNWSGRIPGGAAGTSGWRRRGSWSATMGGGRAFRTATWPTTPSMPICWTCRRWWNAWACRDSFCVGFVNAAPVAIAYAARHPEAVSQLVLWCPWWCGTRSPSSAHCAEQWQGDWELFTEAVAHAAFGWSAGEEAHRFAAYMRECATPEAARAIFRALAEFDVAAVLPQVRSPTLILQRRQATGIPALEIAKALASGIPDARLALLEGASLAPWVGDMEAVLAAIDEFLGEWRARPSRSRGARGGRSLHHPLHGRGGVDGADQRLGDAKAREVLRNHERIVREALRAHGGAEVKAMGDGFMASFSSATRALECAIAMQRAFAEHNECGASERR